MRDRLVLSSAQQACVIALSIALIVFAVGSKLVAWSYEKIPNLVASWLGGRGTKATRQLVDSGEANQPRSRSGESIRQVGPRRMWSPTGIHLAAGQTVRIEADGRVTASLNEQDAAFNWVGPNGWEYQPEFLVGGARRRLDLALGPGSSFLCLIGKVGEGGKPFKVGRRLTLTAETPGELYLGVNQVTQDREGKPIATGDAAEWKDSGGSFLIYLRVSSPPPKTYTLTVEALNPEWKPTGIEVQSGDRLEFQASGMVTWDPQPGGEVGPNGAAWSPRAVSYRPSEFLSLDAPCGSLIGRIGGDVFRVGSAASKRAGASGELYLAINQRRGRQDWRDNRGSFRVTVRHWGP